MQPSCTAILAEERNVVYSVRCDVEIGVFRIPRPPLFARQDPVFGYAFMKERRKGQEQRCRTT
jgi:hypothetical protein